MSLALEFLTDYLERTKTTQADFAKAAGVDPSLFTKLIQEEVGLNSKNVPKLLRGIHTEADRLEFLGKYLQEQIPDDLADGISVRISRAVPTGGALMEDAEEEPVDMQIMHAAAALPSDLYRRRLLRFLVHLRKDGGLRDLFTRTVAYLEESDHELGGTPSYRSPVDPLVRKEDRKRAGDKAGDVPPKETSTGSKLRPTKAPKLS